MKQKWYIVDDMEAFVNSLRTLIFIHFGHWDDDAIKADDFIKQLTSEEKADLDKTLTYEESLLITKQHLRQQRNVNTNEKRYIFTVENYEQILSDLNSRMLSNILTKLSNKGVIETAYDSDADDFVFWLKNTSKSENIDDNIDN
jgi:hypothetical protein